MLSLSRTSRFYRVTFGMALGFSLFAVAAHADGLVVLPEQLSLSAARPVADLQVRNSSAEETTVRFKVTAWRQEGDRERLTPDRRLIVHPESIKLQPGESGRVRVGLKLSGPRWHEEAFQILISETLRIPDVGAETAHSAGRRTMQRGSVPVFLLPPGQANPGMTWRFVRNHEGAVILRASNNGSAHVRLHSASLLGPSGQSIYKGHMSDILLPGGSRSWELAADATAGVWLLTADTNAGPMRAELELDPGLSTAGALTLRD
jgi:P pilus assembly chaperone PapD